MSLLINPYRYAASGGGGGGGLPYTTGLVMHFDASQQTGYADGDRVLQWDDLSGNANHATQGNSSRAPVYRTNVVNGLAVMECRSYGELFLPNVLNGVLTAGEAFFVQRCNDTDNGYHMFGDNNENTHYPFTGSDIYDSFGRTTRPSIGNPGTVTNWHLYNPLSTSSEWSARFNGTQFYTTATNTVGWRTDPKLHANGFWWDGDTAEIILYDHKLSTSDRDAVESYVADKYAITIA